MIAIKMDMPKSCSKCDFEIKENRDICPLLKRMKDVDVDKERHPLCPLIELPEENKDMSWEELVEKVCNEIKEVTAVKFSVDGFDFEYKGIWFNKIGTIIYGNQKIENKTFYQMYQIIKALGDER